MTESLSLSLQPFSRPDKDKESLQYLIQRVNAQRGSFRNFTEQSLEDEIRNAEAKVEDKDEKVVVTATEDVGDTRTKKEELTGAREEILKQTG